MAEDQRDEDERMQPRVVATADGPYRVQGVDRIVWREPITSEDGEPIAWRDRGVVADASQEYWLWPVGQETVLRREPPSGGVSP